MWLNLMESKTIAAFEGMGAQRQFTVSESRKKSFRYQFEFAKV